MKPIILFIDDSPLVLEILSKQLKHYANEEFELLQADSGELGMELFNKLLQSGREYAVIICDFFMPGLKGDAILQWVKTVSPTTSTILLTSYSGPDALKSIINRSSLDFYLSKPWETEEILSIFHKAINLFRNRSSEQKDLLRQTEKNKKLRDQIKLLKQQTGEIQSDYSRLGSCLLHIDPGSERIIRIFNKRLHGIDQDAFHYLEDYIDIIMPNFRTEFKENWKALISGQKKEYSMRYSILSDNVSEKPVLSRWKKEHLQEKEIVIGITQEIEWNLFGGSVKDSHSSEKTEVSFLQSISHEIRTPLNGILGFSKLLTQRNHSEERLDEYREYIQLCSEQLLDTLDKIIDISTLSRQNRGIKKDETVYINGLLKDKYENLMRKIKRTNKNLEIILETPMEDAHAIIQSNRNALHQIFHQLLDNAEKFTEKGMIRFGYEATTPLRFFVEDTGKGIETQHREHIFERFYQGESTYSKTYRGTGLGLSIVLSYLNSLEGSIHVESQPGKGSRFEFVPYPL